MYKIFQVKPFINNNEIIEISKPLKKNFITEGSQSKKFLRKLLDITKAKYGVLVPNGTLAITLAIQSLKLQKDDEIIIPNFTFFGSFSAAILANVKPILCDVDKDNFQICLKSAKKKITKKTKAIMPVHIYGGSVNMILLKKFAKKYNLKIVEDAAQALGVTFKEYPVGSFSHVSAISFYADKTITTSEGGLVITNSKKIYKNLLLLRNQGRLVSGKFIHNHMGYNFRFNDLLSSIGLAQLKKFPKIKRNKLNIYNLFIKKLQKFPQVKFFKPIEGSNFIPFRVPLIVKNKKSLIQYLEKNKIQTREFFSPLHKQKGIREFYDSSNKNDNFFSNSIFAFKNGLALPCYPELKVKDIEFICKKIAQFYENNPNVKRSDFESLNNCEAKDGICSTCLKA